MAIGIERKQMQAKRPAGRRLRKYIALACLIMGLGGCSRMTEPQIYDGGDPFESFNRHMFRFNHLVDHTLVKPVVHVYSRYMPDPIQEAVGHFFANLGDVSNTFNATLQFKGEEAKDDLMRVVINSTLGIGGLFDVASTMDIPRHPQDFGLTLTYWGVHPAYYFVLPFIGPRSVDALVGFYVDGLSLIHI